MSNTSPVEFTDCHLRQSPSDATSMAVTSVLPNVGQYEAYLVEMTIMLLVTDAAIPGMSYDVTAPGTFATSINVLPREDLHGSGGGESEPRHQSSPKGISVDGFEGRVRAGQSLFFSIPYDAPLRTSVYDVAIYAQTGIIDRVSSSHIVQSVAICGLGEGKGVALAPERQTTQSMLPQTFRLTLPRSIPEGTMISVCVQVSYLYNDEELGRDYFYSMLSVRQEPQSKQGYRWIVQLPDNPPAATSAVASGGPGMPTADAYELTDARARIEGLERLIDEIGSQRESSSGNVTTGKTRPSMRVRHRVSCATCSSNRRISSCPPRHRHKRA